MEINSHKKNRLDPNHLSGLKISVLDRIGNLLDDLLSSDSDKKKAELLSYWILDYERMLRAEENYDPKKSLKFKRGQIVKVHLGFRIGNEEGGLHYAIVIDKNNALSSGTVTVIPLTSVKPEKGNIHPNNVFLGNEIYDILSHKYTKYKSDLISQQEQLQEQVDKLKIYLDKLLVKQGADKDIAEDIHKAEMELERITDFRDRLVQKLKITSKMETQLKRMKKGSIALVGQIITISKIRVYDPVSSRDTLGSVRVSDSTLDKIDNKLKELFLGENSHN